MKYRTWYFIDIDNTIMDSLFNSSFYSNDKEKLDNIILAYQKAKNIELYPEFIQWFKKIINQIETFRIYFITGRQKDIFGYLTRDQLRYLKELYPFFKIIFYPNYSNHNWDEYIYFKNDIIMELLNHYISSNDNIKIYDDIDFLEDSTKKTLKGYEFHLITKPEDWNLL